MTRPETGTLFQLPQLIDRAAERQPESEAFVYEARRLTYAGLAEASNRLAHWLIDQGVRRRDRVGVYLHKSLESAVAVYGIMKAGAAYVPLDPAAPVNRTAFVLRDCGIRHLITQEARREEVRQLAAEVGLAGILGLAGAGPDWPGRVSSWEELAAAPAHRPDLRLTEQDLAYVMYTSGSTGTPKGIMHTHRSGLAVATLAAEVFALQPRDRLANHAPLHFDISTFDFFSGPFAGATTVIIPEAHTKLPASLSQLLQDEGISVIFTVPFALSQLLQYGVLAQRDLRAMRWVLFGGEPFPLKHLRGLMAALPQARFANVYGPAEVNQCTFFILPGPPPESAESVPIGPVWANADGLIVDEEDRPVEPGAVGELLIRSATMMRGYWGRPDLNERAFFRREVLPGFFERYYRTGDLVRALPDGNLDFLGRKDRQIKTRGFRVELDEVEAVLLLHEGIREAAVFPLPDDQGSNRIVAAVIPVQPDALTESDLQQHLGARLPWYAVPGQIDFRERFPLTGSGKINRRALAAQAAGGGYHG